MMIDMCARLRRTAECRKESVGCVVCGHEKKTPSRSKGQENADRYRKTRERLMVKEGASRTIIFAMERIQTAGLRVEGRDQIDC